MSRCSACGKVLYRSEKHAREATACLTSAGNRIRVYRCDAGGYHVTNGDKSGGLSPKKRKHQARRRQQAKTRRRKNKQALREDR